MAKANAREREREREGGREKETERSRGRGKKATKREREKRKRETANDRISRPRGPTSFCVLQCEKTRQKYGEVGPRGPFSATGTMASNLWGRV